jgi:hypothetical protein
MYNLSMELYDQLAPVEKAYHDALLGVVDKFGPFDKGSGSVWVGYEDGSNNDNASIGVRCGNCSFHVELSGTTELGCKIVSFNVEENGLCRLAAIPDGLVNAENREDDNDNDMSDMDKFWNGSFIR